MAQKEASWHEVQAGHRAAEEARQRGEDPEIVGAVVDATIERARIGNYVIKPATRGTMMAIQRIAPLLLKHAEQWRLKPSTNPEEPSELDELELALMILIFSDPRRIYVATQNGLPDEILDEAQALTFDYPLLERNKIQAQLEAEMAAVGLVAQKDDQTTPKPGKQSAPNQSSGKLTRQPGAPSQSSTGSCPNTDSDSTPQSGSFPSSRPTPSCPPETNGTEGRPAPATPRPQPSRPETGAGTSCEPTLTSSLGNIHGGYPEPTG